MKLRSAAPRRSQMARPQVPALPGAPLVARVGSWALLFLAGYATLALLTYADVLVRLIGALLTGGSLPTWAFAGFATSIATLALGSLVARTLYRSARQMSDQDPRASVKLALPFIVVVIVHATLVTGPLSRWAQAAPLIGAAWLGVFAVTLVPLAVLAAVIATFSRGRADRWLRELPD